MQTGLLIAKKRAYIGSIDMTLWLPCASLIVAPLRRHTGHVVIALRLRKL